MELNRHPITKRTAIAASKVSKAKTLRTAEAKWEAVVFAHLEAEDYPCSPPVTASTCSLCHRYNRVAHGGFVTELCTKCPLFLLTGKNECGFGNFSQYIYRRAPETALKVLNDIRACSNKPKLTLKPFKEQLKQNPKH